VNPIKHHHQNLLPGPGYAISPGPVESATQETLIFQTFQVAQIIIDGLFQLLDEVTKTAVLDGWHKRMQDI
jgi:hypothetical protein